MLDNVNCDSREMTLLECDRNRLFRNNCDHSKDAGVRCRDDQRVKNVKATASITNTFSTTVSISWELQNNTVSNEPRFFEVECSNERHSTTIVESNQTFNTQLGGISPSTPYNCCVSAVYVSLYAATTVTKACTPIEILNLSANDLNASKLSKCECDWWNPWIHHHHPSDFIGLVSDSVGLSNHETKTEQRQDSIKVRLQLH